MTPLVTWVAALLLAAWQRQEHEGRYRGADDFRALHIDPADALASWRATTLADVGWPDSLAGQFEPSTTGLAAGLGLTRAETLVAALAAAVEQEPRLRPLVAALTDEPTLRQPTVGLAGELAGAVGVTAADVREALGPDGRLAFLDLVRVVPVAGRVSLLDAQLAASDWLVAIADGVAPRDLPGLDWRPAVPGDPVPAPMACSGADHARHAEALTAPAGLVGVLREPTSERLGPAVRAVLARRAALAVAVDGTPEPWLVEAVERAVRLGCPAAVSLAAGVTWVPPASWRQLALAPAGPADRAARWESGLGAAGLTAEPGAVLTVAHEFRLGLDAIGQAVQRVAVAAGPGPAGLDTLRLAARRTAWHDLSSCARPGPADSTWDDLVVTEAVRTQLRDIAAAIGQRGRVLDEWGFGGRPGSRGYHVLFAGPSGTGKTMSAGVIARATGLELWVVDLARVVDKYLGETEKAIDKVLRAAESSGAMLLFDEADALFGRRGEVKEAKDRWANVEVAFLLQRIEEHDGVTVLTTNVSHHLDEAFARRMSQRVEFTIPDARLRRRLWRRSVPAAAPLADTDDLATVADRFELAGGAIRTAALNAAYEAAAEAGAIGLPHLVRATVRELSKAGRTPTRADLGDLGEHLARPA
jgi:hypothetical protein